MTVFNRVKYLADQQRISIVELEEKLNFSRNSLYAWKKSNPSIEKLQKVADYFNVSTDYLLGRTDNPEVKDGDETIIDINSAPIFAFDGEPVSEEERLLLKSIIETYRKNKKKE